MLSVCVFFIVLLTLPLAGIQNWINYLPFISKMNECYVGCNAAFSEMVNLRGVLSSAFSQENWKYISKISLVLYSALLVSAFYLGRYITRRQIDLGNMFPLAVITALYFSPWFHIQDYYLLLPVVVLITPDLVRMEKTGWLLVPYMGAAFGFGKHISIVLHRGIMIFLLFLISYASFRILSGNADLERSSH